jgi:hypothetical protein
LWVAAIILYRLFSGAIFFKLELLGDGDVEAVAVGSFFIYYNLLFITIVIIIITITNPKMYRVTGVREE